MSSGKAVVLKMTSGSDNVTLGAGVNGLTGKVEITSTGSIMQSGTGVISAGEVDLTASGASIGSSGTPLLTSTGTLNAAAIAGSIYITNSGGAALNLGVINASGAVQLVSDGDITLTALNCSCLGNYVTGSTVSIYAVGNVSLDMTSTGNPADSITSTGGDVAIYAGYNFGTSTYVNASTATAARPARPAPRPGTSWASWTASPIRTPAGPRP